MLPFAIPAVLLTVKGAAAVSAATATVIGGTAWAVKRRKAKSKEERADKPRHATKNQLLDFSGFTALDVFAMAVLLLHDEKPLEEVETAVLKVFPCLDYQSAMLVVLHAMRSAQDVEEREQLIKYFTRALQQMDKKPEDVFDLTVDDISRLKSILLRPCKE